MYESKQFTASRESAVSHYLNKSERSRVWTPTPGKNILTVRPRVLIVLTWRYDSACILRNSLIRAANKSMLFWEIQLDGFSVLAAGYQARISRITTAGNSPAT